MNTRRFALAALLAFTACNSTPDKEPPPRRTAAPSGSAPNASAPSTASAAPPASATAKSAAAETGFVGTWEGTYDAKKGTVSLPPKVKDKALAADDGKKMAGAGTIEIAIGEGGELKGKSKGALGASTITGKAEESMIRATVLPDDPRAPDAMTGVLVGVLKGDVIKGEIRVAGPDATVVRESPIELKRK